MGLFERRSANGGASEETPATEPEAQVTPKAKVYAFTNQKGGVGKTTTTLNLAAAFVEAGFRVLCVDLDPQANLTMSARWTSRAPPSTWPGRRSPCPR